MERPQPRVGVGVEGTLLEEQHPPEKEGDTVLSVHPEDMGELCGSQCRWPGWNSGGNQLPGRERWARTGGV